MNARVWQLVAVLCLLSLLISPAAGPEHVRASEPRRGIILVPGMLSNCSALVLESPVPGLGRVPGIESVAGIDPGDLARLCDNNDPNGYNAEARAAEVFATIQSQVTQRQAGQNLSWDAFSYAPAWQTTPVYFGADTRQPLADSARLLGDQIRAWGTEDVAYTIVAHSIGGDVAAYWAATEADPATLAAVRSVVTLDSPVQGFKPYDVAFWTGEVTGQAGRDLENPAVAATMQQSVDRVSMFTLGNTLDQVVPAYAAILEGGCRPGLSCVMTLGVPGRLNHYQILDAEPTIGLIDRLVSGDVP